jgi:Dolichyl-phosphate-mannose-protein mannosyltransferase
VLNENVARSVPAQSELRPPRSAWPLERLRGLRDGRWFAPLVLAVPYLVGIAALQGLTGEVRTFHVEDEGWYHLPTIRQFGEQLPAVDFESYPAAQTPLFHLLFALWGKVVGFELWGLRLLNVAISYVTLLVLFRWLRRGFGFDQPQALALTLLFGLSPHVLGVSFAVLTDNLSTLFGILALERFHRTSQNRSLRTFAIGCAAMAAAILTRQSFVWLAPIAAWALLTAVPSPRRFAAGATVACVSLLPFAALVVIWGGLVPEGADPASCGLCSSRAGVPDPGPVTRALGFSVALFGLYAAVAYAPIVARRLRSLAMPPLPVVAFPVLLGAALAGASELVYRPPVTLERLGDEGYLWRIADQLPVVASTSSLAFWALVPLGALALTLLARRSGWLSLPVVYLVTFLTSTLAVRLIYQKYFDPFVLLGLILLVRPSDLRSARDYAGIAVLMAGSLAYAAKFYV